MSNPDDQTSEVSSFSCMESERSGGRGEERQETSVEEQIEEVLAEQRTEWWLQKHASVSGIKSGKGETDITKGNRRGRKTNAERLGRERKSSTSSTISIASLWKRGRESESEEGEEEGESSHQKSKRKREKGDKEGDTSIKGIKKKVESNEKDSEKGHKMEEIKILLEGHKKSIIDEIIGELNRNKEDAQKMFEEFKKECREREERMTNKNKELKRKVEVLERRCEAAEKREKKKNIIIKGASGRKESVEEVVKDVFKEMGCVGYEKRIEDMFEIGKGKEKAILVKMERYEDKRKLLEKRTNLKGSRIFVDDDLTIKERMRQKKIRAWAKNEREKGATVKIGYNRAFKNGTEYVWNDECGEMRVGKFQGGKTDRN